MRFSKEHTQVEGTGKSFCVRALSDSHMERMGRREFSEKDREKCC